MNAANQKTEDIGCNFFVFRIRYQNFFPSPRDIKLIIKIDVSVPTGGNAYAFILTNILKPIKGDGQ